MSNSNDVRLIGNAGGSLEIRTLDSGVKVGGFSIAVNNNFTDSKGQPVSNVNWFRVVLYGKVLEALEGKIEKGKRLSLVGELRQREYLNQSQQKISVVEIVASVIYVFQ